MKNLLSVCMIARNEEQNITVCLEALRPFVEELIVVDTGSTDRTAQLAREAGARVFTWAWTDSFSEARNFAIEQATMPLVFMVDADERFDPAGADVLAAFCRRADQMVGRVQIRNLLDEGTYTTVEITRLFPNRPEFRYRGRIHEQLFEGEHPPQSVSTGVVLVHHGYTQQMVVQANKIERNLRLLQLDRQEAPDDPYIAYQIGKTYYVGRSYNEAVAAFRQAIHLLGQQSLGVPTYLSTLLIQFSYALLALREYEALANVVSTGVELFPEFTDLYFVYGLGLIEAGDSSRLPEIRDVFLHCLRLGEPDASIYETVGGVGTFRAHHNLGVFYEVTGEISQAKAHYRLAFADGFAPSGERFRQLGDDAI